MSCEHYAHAPDDCQESRDTRDYIRTAPYTKVDKSRSTCTTVPAVARTPAQRGRIGNWLVESRLARGWDTQEKARAEIARLTGWDVAQSVYAEWESGRRIPSDANLARLEEFYGKQETGPAQGEAGLAEAMDRQTAVLSALLSWLQGQDERLAAIEAAVALNRQDIEALGRRAGHREQQAGGAAGELAPHQT